MMYDLRDGHFQGRLYLSSTPPLGLYAANGKFGLTLFAYSEPAPGLLTPWRLLWGGEPAQAFWRDHADALLPGKAIHVDLASLRVHDGAGRGVGAEIHAAVVAIEMVWCLRLTPPGGVLA